MITMKLIKLAAIPAIGFRYRGSNTTSLSQ
jgi:hypothetical protein